MNLKNNTGKLFTILTNYYLLEITIKELQALGKDPKNIIIYNIICSLLPEKPLMSWNTLASVEHHVEDWNRIKRKNSE